jgi:hypothetical protein
VLSLVEANPDRFVELASAKVLTARGREVWANMALSDGRLLVRDRHQLKCLDLRAAGKPGE